MLVSGAPHASCSRWEGWHRAAQPTAAQLLPLAVLGATCPEMVWSGLRREVVESPSQEALKNCRSVALRVMVSGFCGDELMVGLGDLSILFQP